MKIMFKGLMFVGLLTVCAILAGTQGSYANEKKVQIRFEIDGKQIKPKNIAVIFHSSNGSFLAKLKKSYIVVPEKILKEQTFDVQIVWNIFSVVFPSVHRDQLNAIWTVGANRPPLKDNSLRSSENKYRELIILYYLKTDPNDLVKDIIVEVFK